MSLPYEFKGSTRHAGSWMILAVGVVLLIGVMANAPASGGASPVLIASSLVALVFVALSVRSIAWPERYGIRVSREEIVWNFQGSSGRIPVGEVGRIEIRSDAASTAVLIVSNTGVEHIIPDGYLGEAARASEALIAAIGRSRIMLLGKPAGSPEMNGAIPDGKATRSYAYSTTSVAGGLNGFFIGAFLVAMALMVDSSPKLPIHPGVLLAITGAGCVLHGFIRFTRQVPIGLWIDDQRIIWRTFDESGVLPLANLKEAIVTEHANYRSLTIVSKRGLKFQIYEPEIGDFDKAVGTLTTLLGSERIRTS